MIFHGLGGPFWVRITRLLLHKSGDGGGDQENEKAFASQKVVGRQHSNSNEKRQQQK